MKSVKILFVAICLTALLSVFAFAQAETEDEKQNEKQNENLSVANLTYGACVSQYAIVKNGCFLETKETRAVCKTEAGNLTESKAAMKQCRKDYAASKKECKADFKKGKTDCRQLKAKAKQKAE